MSTNRNNVIGGFEDAIEKGHSGIKSSVTKTAGNFANTTKNQIIAGSNNSSQQGAGTNEAGNSPSDPSQSQMTDEQRVEFLSNLYGGSNSNESSKNDINDEKKQQKGAGEVKQALGIPIKDPYEGKSPEDIAKIKALEKKLHSEYLQDLINRARPKEEPVTEKLEREEEEKKMAELVEESKKPSAPINPQVTRQGTGERVGNTIG